MIQTTTPEPPAVKLPRTLGREPRPGGVCLRIEVPAELAWFAGHFPERPILPGVAQIGWAIAYAREQFGFAGDPSVIDRVKFLRATGPGARLELELRRHGDYVEWELSERCEALSRGRLAFPPR